MMTLWLIEHGGVMINGIPKEVIVNGDCDKVIMLTHTYPHKPLRKIKWPPAITKLTTHFAYGLMSDLVIASIEKSVVIHDTECPDWDQVSLNNITL